MDGINIFQDKTIVPTNDDLEQATKYAEGRGIRIEIKDNKILADIEKLIVIKLAN